MIKRIATAAALVFVTVAAPATAAEKTVTLAVENMTCSTCPITVRMSLTKLTGVKAADVSFERKTATVTFDDGKTSVEALVKATTEAGYPAKPAP